MSENEIFEARANVPRLTGDSLSKDVSESRRQLDDIKWPTVEKQNYWPDDVKKQGTTNAGNKVPAITDSKDDADGVLTSTNYSNDFISPFGVEAWGEE